MKRIYLYLDRVPYFHLIHPGKRLHIINVAAKIKDQIYYILPNRAKTQSIVQDSPANIIHIN